MHFIKELFKGRVGRLAFLFGSLYYFLSIFIPYLIVLFVYIEILFAITPHPNKSLQLDPLYALTGLLYVTLIVANLSIAARRLNDVDRPTWFCVFILVPFVDIPLTIYLLLAPGTQGRNSYGAPLKTYGFWEVTKFKPISFGVPKRRKSKSN